MPKVTVLMPVYNGEEYLQEAIESILHQTFEDFEFVIIDDGSTDSTKKIILSYNDPRIRLLENKKNIGITLSLNIGINVAKGEYIARQDADDISLPHRFFRQVGFLDSHSEFALVGSSYDVINECGGLNKKVYVQTENEVIKDGLWGSNLFVHGAVMMRKSSVDAVGRYNEGFTHAEDYDLWLRLANRYKVANFAEVLYQLRIHAKSIGSKYPEEQTKSFFRVKEMALSKREELPSLQELSCEVVNKLGRFNLANIYYGFGRKILKDSGITCFRIPVRKWKYINVVKNYYFRALRYNPLHIKTYFCLGLFFLGKIIVKQAKE